MLFRGTNMEKSKKNKAKDIARRVGKIWIDKSTPYSERTTGSGITFGGKYVCRREDTACSSEQEE